MDGACVKHRKRSEKFIQKKPDHAKGRDSFGDLCLMSKINIMGHRARSFWEELMDKFVFSIL